MMVREWLSAIPRGAKAAVIATTALLAFMLLWRAVAIIVSDVVSYASRH
jgi:preprotein translocase subunit SecD